METIMTRRGRRVEVVSAGELRGPVVRGEYVRAFCHIHGSDHQRSLSIHRRSGWGHCFNAACDAVVLVREWNTPVAARLLRAETVRELRETPAEAGDGGLVNVSPTASGVARDVTSETFVGRERLPVALQSVLLHVPPVVQPWQREELGALEALDDYTRSSLLVSRRARVYLEERGISEDLARECGVTYLAPDVVPTLRRREERALMRRWAARLLFPLTSPVGNGYIGRSLWRWQPGMDENAHKRLLDATNGVRRWIKSNPAGWFACPLAQLARSIIVVEGAFDRLTLMSAGFAANEVVALTGTAMQADWLPGQVRTIVLALDGDDGGDVASARLADQLAGEGFVVKQCRPPRDRWGKDWNERWQRIGYESVWPLREACSTLRSA